MPHIGHRFLPPTRVAPLATPEVPDRTTTKSAKTASEPTDDGFDDKQEVARVPAMPRMRAKITANPARPAKMTVAASAASASASSSASSGQVMSSPPGTTVKNPFLTKVSVSDWHLNPNKVADALFDQQ